MPELFTDSELKLIERYRDINVDTSWWYQNIYEDHRTNLLEKGIDVDDFSFSGFWCQGDGASFTATIDPVVFMRATELDFKYSGMFYLAENDLVHAVIRRGNSNYCHENTVQLELDYINEYNPYDEEDLRHSITEIMLEQAEEEYKECQLEMDTICKQYMRLLYADLRNEYEYLTSDEAVWDTICANELNQQVA